MRLALALTAALLWIFGCQVVEGPELLTLAEIGPVTVSAGDRLELTGQGFPQGRRAVVLLRGTLHRAGSRPIEGVELELSGFAHSSSRLTVSLDDATLERFVGSAGHHTTFEGDVRARFASRTRGAPAVMGTLRGVVLDFVPTEERPGAAQRATEGRRLLAHLGITADGTAARGPMRVGEVTPGSAADRAGLRPGDALARVGGVRVRTVADLAVARGTETLALVVERAGLSETFVVEVPLDGFAPPAPSDLGPAAVLLGLLVTLSILLAGPLSRLSSWAERGVLLAVRRERSPRPLSGRLLVWLSPTSESAGRGAVGLPLLAFVATVATFATVASGRDLVGGDVDLALLYGASLVCLCAGRLVDGGVRPGRSWALGLGLLSVLETAVFVLPGFVALAALAFATESVSLTEIARAQGGAPWRWWGLVNPGLAVGAGLLLLTAAPMGVRGRGPFASLEGAVGQDATAAPAFACAMEWLHAWMTVALAVSLYFGGFQIPLVSALWAPSPWLSALGCVLFVMKMWAAMIVVVTARALSSRLGVEPLLGPWLLRALPTSAFAAGLAVVWAEAADRLDLAPELAGSLLFGVVVASAAVVLLRLRTLPQREPLAGSVNPWL